MAVNLTLIAAEAFNEIVLRHLQNEGLASAEKTQQAFYQAFQNLYDAPDEELFFENETHTNINKAIVGKEYMFLYQNIGGEAIILNICHTSRKP